MLHIPGSFKVGGLTPLKQWEPDLTDLRTIGAFLYYVKVEPCDGSAQVVSLNVQKSFMLSEF